MEWCASIASPNAQDSSGSSQLDHNDLTDKKGVLLAQSNDEQSKTENTNQSLPALLLPDSARQNVQDTSGNVDDNIDPISKGSNLSSQPNDGKTRTEKTDESKPVEKDVCPASPSHNVQDSSGGVSFDSDPADKKTPLSHQQNDSNTGQVQTKNDESEENIANINVDPIDKKSHLAQSDKQPRTENTVNFEKAELSSSDSTSQDVQECSGNNDSTNKGSPLAQPNDGQTGTKSADKSEPGGKGVHPESTGGDDFNDGNPTDRPHSPQQNDEQTRSENTEALRVNVAGLRKFFE